MSNAKIEKQLAARLKKVRKESGLSQREFGKALKLSDKAISSYEVGRAVPNLETLQKISKLTYRPLAYFLDQGDSNRYELHSKLEMIERELSEIKRMLGKEEEK